VASGIEGVAEDGRAVASDVTGLASGLGADASAIPSWPAAARERAGELIADPVVVEADRLGPVAGAGAGLAPYFAGLALWLGALTLFLVVPAVRGREPGGRWWVAPLEAFLVAAAIGIGQALLVLLAVGLVGVRIERVGEALALAALAIVTFVALTQALVALLGNRGWLVALLLVVVQAAAAGAPYPIETAPGLVQAVHPLLPLTHAVEALRTAIAGGGPAVAPAVLALGLWLAGSLLVTLAAAGRRASHGRRGATSPAAA
jgi:putative membrane protein